MIKLISNRPFFWLSSKIGLMDLCNEIIWEFDMSISFNMFSTNVVIEIF